MNKRPTVLINRKHLSSKSGVLQALSHSNTHRIFIAVNENYRSFRRKTYPSKSFLFGFLICCTQIYSSVLETSKRISLHFIQVDWYIDAVLLFLCATIIWIKILFFLMKIKLVFFLKQKEDKYMKMLPERASK